MDLVHEHVQSVIDPIPAGKFVRGDKDDTVALSIERQFISPSQDPHRPGHPLTTDRTEQCLAKATQATQRLQQALAAGQEQHFADRAQARQSSRGKGGMEL